MSRAVQKAILLVTLAMCALPLAAAEGEPPANRDAKVFEAVVTFSQSLSGWALLIAGGSIVILVGTAYYRPQRWWARLMYLAFLPGWYFLGRGMYFGIYVQRAYLGYLFSNPVNDQLMKFKGAINDDALRQIVSIQHAVYCFGGWLLLYFIWWVCNSDVQKPSGGTP